MNNTAVSPVPSCRRFPSGASLLTLATLCLAAFSCPFSAGAQGLAGAVPFNYSSVRIVAGGFVTGIVSLPGNGDVRYARTDIGGTYRWEPSTKTWTPLLDFLNDSQFNYIGTEAIGLDPNDSNRLYLAAGTYTESFEGNGAILVSNDRGNHFNIVPLPIKLGSNDAGRFAGERLIVDPNNGAHVFFGSRLNGLWGSLDYGQTWAQVASFPVKGPTGTAADPGVGVIFGYFEKASGTIGTGANTFTKTAYVGVSDGTTGLYVTHDGGQSFAAVAGQPTGMYPNSMASDPSGNLYIAYGSSQFGNSVGPYSMSAGAIWKYTPATGAWTNITPPNPNHYSYGFGSVAVDPVNPSILMVSTMDRYYPPPQDDIYRSVDGGKTWVSIDANVSRDFSLSPWVTFGSPTPGLGNWANHIFINPSNHNEVSYGDGQTIWTTEDIEGADSASTQSGAIAPGGPTHWSIGALGVEETAILALASPTAGPAHLISGMYDLGGFTHTNLGQSPRQGANIQPNIGAISSIDFAAAKPLTIVQTGNAAPFGSYSRDGGLTFTGFAANPTHLATGAGSVAVTADGDTLLWAPQDSGAQTYFSNDNGTTWTASAGSAVSTGSTIQLVTDRVNPQFAYEYNPATGVLLVSDNRGQSFRQTLTASTYGSLYASPLAQGDLWLATGGGLSHSTDGGKSFKALADVSTALNLGFGKAAPGSGVPTLFLRGKVSGSPADFDAFFASIDYGKTWYVINDEQHQYGNTDTLVGDPRVYGRYYIGTNGRGIIEGDLAR